MKILLKIFFALLFFVTSTATIADVSFIEKTKSEFCTVVKKQITLTNNKVIGKTSEIVKKYSKNKLVKEISKIEKIAKKSVIYNRR